MLENNLIPDVAVRASHNRFMGFLETLRENPVAIHTVDANEQHYELPPAFSEKFVN